MRGDSHGTTHPSFRPPTAAQELAILAKTAKFAANGEFELFKTSAHFDGPARTPAWLSGDATQVRKLASANGG